jgi:hypothetical protein
MADRRRGLRPYIDPIALTGVILSIIVSVALDLTGAASGVESFLACLMGITLSLVLDSTVRSERRYRLRELVDAVPWLSESLTPLAAATNDIQHRYAGTSVALAAQAGYARLAEELDDLRHGRIVRPRGDYEHLLQATRDCRRTLLGVTNVLVELPGRGLAWWGSAIGRQYWRANKDALARGVRIERIFLYTSMTAELDQLVTEQIDAGVQVRLVQATTVDPALWQNLALWDGICGWEAKLNAGGEIVGNIFTMSEPDLARLTATFQACTRAGRSRDQLPATPH